MSTPRRRSALGPALSLQLAAAAALSALATWPGPAWATSPEPDAAPPSAAAPAPPAVFRSDQRGLTSDLEYSSTRLTEGVALSAGARTVHLEAALDGPWVVRWDLGAAVRGGLAIVQPYSWVAGARVAAAGELGHRLLPGAWSTYVMVGGRLRGEYFHRWLIIEEVGTVRESFTRLDLVPRFGLGATYQDARRSLRAVAFAEAGWRLTNYQGTTDATAFGLSLGYDVADRLSLLAEASLATEPAATTPGLALVDLRSTRSLELSARKIFRSGSWVGLDLTLTEQTDRLRYLDSGLALTTRRPGTFVVAVSYGLNLGG